MIRVGYGRNLYRVLVNPYCMLLNQLKRNSRDNDCDTWSSVFSSISHVVSKSTSTQGTRARAAKLNAFAFQARIDNCNQGFRGRAQSTCRRPIRGNEWWLNS